MKKVIAIRLKESTKAVIDAEDNKSAFISKAIEKHNGHCPLCQRNIRGNNHNNKGGGGGRITKKAEEILDGISMPLRYVSYILDIETNHCPICGGKNESIVLEKTGIRKHVKSRKGSN